MCESSDTHRFRLMGVLSHLTLDLSRFLQVLFIFVIFMCFLDFLFQILGFYDLYLEYFTQSKTDLYIIFVTAYVKKLIWVVETYQEELKRFISWCFGYISCKFGCMLSFYALWMLHNLIFLLDSIFVLELLLYSSVDKLILFHFSTSPFHSRFNVS